MSISPGKPRLLKKTHCYASFRSYNSSDIKATCEMGMCIRGGKWVWIITRLLYREESGCREVLQFCSFFKQVQKPFKGWP